MRADRVPQLSFPVRCGAVRCGAVRVPAEVMLGPGKPRAIRVIVDFDLHLQLQVVAAFAPCAPSLASTDAFYLGEKDQRGGGTDSR